MSRLCAQNTKRLKCLQQIKSTIYKLCFLIQVLSILLPGLFIYSLFNRPIHGDDRHLCAETTASIYSSSCFSPVQTFALMFPTQCSHSDFLSPLIFLCWWLTVMFVKDVHPGAVWSSNVQIYLERESHVCKNIICGTIKRQFTQTLNQSLLNKGPLPHLSVQLCHHSPLLSLLQDHEEPMLADDDR